MAAYRDGTVSIVAKRDAEGPVRVVQSVGAKRPIHATAVAKAIVAFLPEAELRACCRGYVTTPLRHRPSRRKRRSPRNLSAFGCPATPMTTKSISRVFDA